MTPPERRRAVLTVAQAMLEEESRARRKRKHGGGAAPATSTPATPDTFLDRSNVVCCFRSENLYKDVLTTLAANGDTAQTWLDTGPTGYVLREDTNKPDVGSYTNNGKTFLAARGNGTNKVMTTTIALPAMGTSDYTIMLVAYFPDTTHTYRTIASLAAFTPALYTHLLNIDLYDTTDHLLGLAPSQAAWHSLVISRDAGNVTMMVDGVDNPAVAAAASYPAAKLLLWSDQSGDFGDCRIEEAGILGEKSSAAQRTAIYAQHTARTGV